MWGSIPYHAHNFLIRFAIGVRTTIELMMTCKNFMKKGLLVLLVIVYCPCTIKGAGDEDSLTPHITIYTSALPEGFPGSSSG